MSSRKYLSSSYGQFLLMTGVILSLLMGSCKDKTEVLLDNEDLLGFSKMDSITLQLEQIKILFPSVEQWEEKGAIQYSGDSAVVFDRNSEMLLEKPFSINLEATQELLVEMQYETKLSIIHQDGNIDLSKLKNYVSPWQKISAGVANRYIKTAFTQDDINQFPETPINQVLEHLFWETRTTQSEFDWTKYLKQAKSIRDFPFRISISKITLRFRGNYLDGRPFNKYIIFYLG
jgi:hypothetical protein